jgi:hypothetical protein
MRKEKIVTYLRVRTRYGVVTTHVQAKYVVNLGNEPSISEIFNSLEVDDILRMNASTFDLADMWRLARIIL